MSRRQQRARLRRHRHAVGGLTLAASLVGAGSAQAATTLTVTNLDPSGAGSLAAAMATADGDSGDTIVFASGLSGTITPGSALSITAPMTIEGPGAGTVTISGGGTAGIFSVHPPANSFDDISGLTLNDAHNNTGAGSINLVDGGLTLENVVISGSVGLDGGAIYADNSWLLISGSEFSGDMASDDGGAILANHSFLAVSGSTFSGDVGTSGGGAIALDADSPTTISGSVLSGNTAGYAADAAGGAVDDAFGSSLSIVSSQLTGNKDSGSGSGVGGGAVSAESAAVTVDDSTVAGNAVSSKGTSIIGGAICELDGSLAISGSTLSGNSAATSVGTSISAIGGAVYASGTLAVVGSTFTGNAASAANAAEGYGGAIESYGIPGTIVASTISGNSASGAGAGLETYRHAELAVRDSIVAGNSAPSDPDADGNFQTSFDLIGSSAGLVSASPLPGSDIVGLPAQLGPLAMNGGPTATMLPAAGSPAVNAGDAFGLTADQRGLPRVVPLAGVPSVADGSDIGAVEVQTPVAVPVAPAPVVQTVVVPSNLFLFGALKKPVKSKAALALTLPGPGVVSVRGGGIAAFSGRSLKEGPRSFTLKLTKSEAKRFARTHKGTLSLTVTFTPTGGMPYAASRRFKL